MKNKSIIKFIDFFALTLIACFSLGYVIDTNIFAEQHIKFSFLDFPVFVGEILFFLCLMLFFIRRMFVARAWRLSDFLVIFYIGFVLIKAFTGYVEWGPLALRHAAMFYYLFFAVLTYVFLKDRDIPVWSQRMLLVFILVMLLLRMLSSYWALSFFVFGVLLLLNERRKSFFWMGIIVLMLCTPWHFVFKTSRMMIVATFVMVSFLGLAIPFMFSAKRLRTFLATVLVFLIFCSGFLFFSRQTALLSIFSFKEMVQIFKYHDGQIREGECNMTSPSTLEVHFYNPTKASCKERAINIESQEEGCEVSAASREDPGVVEVVRVIESQEGGSEVSAASREDPGVVEVVRVIESQEEGREVISSKSKKMLIEIESMVEDFNVNESTTKKQQKNIKVSAMKREGRDFSSSLYTAVFRLFIWRDLIQELYRKKPLLGFDFGKPFRSKSLECLNWGTTEWLRDGWIGVHNSYLHMIYRAGFIGVALLVAIAIIFIMMIRMFILKRSLAGILLCGIMVQWFAAANFLLILELPYTAILIWSIYGLTFAHYIKVRKKSE